MYKMKKQLAVLMSAAMLTGTLGMSAPYSVTAEASGVQKEIYISPAGDDAAGTGVRKSHMHPWKEPEVKCRKSIPI